MKNANIGRNIKLEYEYMNDEESTSHASYHGLFKDINDSWRDKAKKLQSRRAKYLNYLQFGDTTNREHTRF